MQTDSSNNTIWRTIVLTSAGGILGFFIVRFLFGASSDMQGFVIGIGFGGFGGFAVGWFAGLMHSRSPQEQQQAVADAYARGHNDGLHAGYRAAIASDGVVEVVIPTQARELVRAGGRYG